MPGPSRVVTLMVDPTTAVAQIDAHYLSVAVDTAQVVGANWRNLTGNAHDPTVKLPVYDFTRPALLVLARGSRRRSCASAAPRPTASTTTSRPRP